MLGIGLNDSIELEGDYWKKLEPVPYSEKLKIVKSNIIEIIQQAKKEKIMLILTSLLPINIPILRYERDRKMYIKELNEWLMEMAKMNNLIFVNYYATMTFPGTDKLLDGITYDGLHPNAKGYQIMATVLKNTLKKNGIRIGKEKKHERNGQNVPGGGSAGKDVQQHERRLFRRGAAGAHYHGTEQAGDVGPLLPGADLAAEERDSIRNEHSSRGGGPRA